MKVPGYTCRSPWRSADALGGLARLNVMQTDIVNLRSQHEFKCRRVARHLAHGLNEQDWPGNNANVRLHATTQKDYLGGVGHGTARSAAFVRHVL